MNRQTKNRQRKFRNTFKGKTIVKVDASAVNHIVFHFSDGSKVSLETEYMGHGIYGIEKAKQ